MANSLAIFGPEYVHKPLVIKITMQVMNQNKPKYNILHLHITFHGRFSDHITAVNLTSWLDFKPLGAGPVYVGCLAQGDPNPWLYYISTYSPQINIKTYKSSLYGCLKWGTEWSNGLPNILSKSENSLQPRVLNTGLHFPSLLWWLINAWFFDWDYQVQRSWLTCQFWKWNKNRSTVAKHISPSAAVDHFTKLCNLLILDTMLIGVI